jgi:hypothetical protein
VLEHRADIVSILCSRYRGLFDVNMPLLYSEGVKAFTRLQEAILNESEDQSLFAWNPCLIPGADPSERDTSVFARHPLNFASSHDIKPTVTRGEPCVITNRGIRMELPILAMEKRPPVFLAVLHCIHEKCPSSQATIVLRRHRVDGGTHTYIRHESAPITMLNFGAIHKSDTRQVYLRKQIPTAALDYDGNPLANVKKLRQRGDFEEARLCQPGWLKRG